MAKDELDPLRSLLIHAVGASKVSNSQIESTLGLGRGNLNRMLKGRYEIRVKHVVRLARILGVPPADFLELAFPDLAAAATHRLADWIGPARPAFKTEPAAAGAALGPEELRDLIRAAVREELADSQPKAVRRRGTDDGGA